MSFAPQALAAGAVAIVGEKPPEPAIWPTRPSCGSRMSAPPCRAPPPRSFRASRKISSRSPAPAARPRSPISPARFLPLAAFRRVARHHRRHKTVGRGLWLADHARSGDPAQDARRSGGEGVTHLAHGGVVARTRPAPSRWRAPDGRGLSPICRATISITTPISKTISPPNCACSTRCCSRARRAVIAADGDFSARVIDACFARGLRVFSRWATRARACG